MRMCCLVNYTAAHEIGPPILWEGRMQFPRQVPATKVHIPFMKDDTKHPMRNCVVLLFEVRHIRALAVCVILGSVGVLCNNPTHATAELWPNGYCDLVAVL